MWRGPGLTRGESQRVLRVLEGGQDGLQVVPGWVPVAAVDELTGHFGCRAHDVVGGQGDGWGHRAAAVPFFPISEEVVYVINNLKIVILSPKNEFQL